MIIGASSRRAAARASFALSLASLGCGAPRPLAHEGTVAWRRGLARLEAIRAAASPARPRTMRLSLALREPLSGRSLRARGAVALAPPHAMRMILLGPGGTTALDLWSHDDRFRFAVPPLDLVKRGDATTPRASMRGMPIDFLRFWLLRAASGRLLWHERTQSGDRFVLRDEAAGGGARAIVDLVAHDDGRVTATRATFASPSADGSPGRRIERETFEASALGCATVTYRQETTGLVAEASCEGDDGPAPSPRAFVDPDAEAAR